MGKPLNSEEYVQVTVPIIIIILGLFGNILSCVVLLRKNFRSLSINIYLLAISVLDSIFLLSSFPLIVAFGILLGVDYRAFSMIGCATSHYIIRASRTMSVWIMAVLTVERMLIISLSHKKDEKDEKDENDKKDKKDEEDLSEKSSQKRAAIATLLVIISAGAICLYCFFVFDLHPRYSTNFTCKWNIDIDGERIDYHIYIFDFLISYLVPYTIMATSCSALAIFLYNNWNVREPAQVDNRNATVTIVALSLSSFLLSEPYWIAIILSMNNENIEFAAHLPTVFHSFDLLTYSVKCLLFSVTIPAFRKEIKSMSKSCRKRISSICSAVCHSVHSQLNRLRQELNRG